jgi:hypothetical protein
MSSYTSAYIMKPEGFLFTKNEAFPDNVGEKKKANIEF